MYASIDGLEHVVWRRRGEPSKIVGGVGHAGVHPVDDAGNHPFAHEDLVFAQIAVGHGWLETPPRDVLELVFPPVCQSRRHEAGLHAGVEFCHASVAVVRGLIDGQALVFDEGRRQFVDLGERPADRRREAGPWFDGGEGKRSAAHLRVDDGAAAVLACQ